MKFESKRWSYLMICLIICLCSGIGYAWSVFQKPICTNFGWSAKDVSLTFTLQVLMSTMTPLVLGNLIKKLKTRQVILIGGVVFGISVFSTAYIQAIWQLYIVYGIASGVGIGLIYPCLMAYSVKLFPDKKGMSAGLLAASYGSGAILWAPVAATITQNYGVLTAFKVLGVIFLVVIATLSMFIGEVPENYMPAGYSCSATNGSTARVKDQTRKEMVKNPIFYAVLVMFILGTTSGLLLMGHASPILQEEMKVTPEKAAVIVGILAIFNTCGRVLWGWVSDKVGRYPVVFGLFIFEGLAMFTLSAADSFPIFVGAMLLVGLCYGGFATMIAPVTADMFGIKNLTANYGLMYIAYGIAGILGPQLATLFKNYSQGFVVASVLSIVGIGFAAFISIKNKINNG